MDTRTYQAWLEERTTRSDDVVFGSRVFRGTRLSVLRVGQAPERCMGELLEDYPYLSKADIRFAREYARKNEPRRARAKAAG